MARCAYDSHATRRRGSSANSYLSSATTSLHQTSCNGAQLVVAAAACGGCGDEAHSIKGARTNVAAHADETITIASNITLTA